MIEHFSYSHKYVQGLFQDEAYLFKLDYFDILWVGLYRERSPELPDFQFLDLYPLVNLGRTAVF